MPKQLKINIMDSMYQILVADNGEFYFNLFAPNSKVIGTSETYKTIHGCFTGIASVQKNSPDFDNYEIRFEDTPEKRPYFVLKAQNGEIVLKGQSYFKKYNCKVGIHAVMKYGPFDNVMMERELSERLKVENANAEIQAKKNKVGVTSIKSVIQPFINAFKTGRNELCFCGSFKKYKHCCINKEKK